MNGTVLNIVQASNHRMVRYIVTLDLKRERDKLFRIKKPNISTVIKKSDEFAI